MDPVDGATGNFLQQKTDLSLAGVGVPFEFTRTYNSLDRDGGPLGLGWTHSYAASLAIDATTGDVTYRSSNGQKSFYAKQQDGSFLVPPGGPPP